MKDQILIIRNEVAKYRRFTEAEMLAKGKKREIVISRQLCCYFAYNHCKSRVSLDVIAKTLNFPSYDHAVVIYSLRTMKNLIDTDKAIMKTVVELESIISDKLNNLQPYSRKWNGKYDYNETIR